MAVNNSAMSSCMSSCMGPGASSTPWPSAEGLLEASIPGFSILSNIAQNYFRLDISAIITLLLPVAAFVATIRYAYGPLSTYVWRYGVSSVEIRNDDEMYNYLNYWISQQKFVARSRSFVAGTKTASDLVYDAYDDDDEDVAADVEIDWELAEENFDKYWAQTTARDKIKTIYYTPGNGTHYFKFKGQYLSFARDTQEQRIGRYTDRRETLTLSCLGRDTLVLKDLLREAQKMYIERDSTKTIIYRKSGEGDDWSRCMARPPRPLSTVVLDPKQKAALVADIKEYLHPLTKRWYANRGIPYRRGYLLYGPPGTGKTSLCVAIAGKFGLKVYVTSLNSRTLTEESLATLFGWLPDRCVVLLEDVDSAGITHKRDADAPLAPPKDAAQEALETAAGLPQTATPLPASPSGISLSGLLNVIDGVASSEGRILIMTTNHVEKLDPALLRPGRVDMSIAFENANTETARELFESTYGSREEDYPQSSRYSDVKKQFPRKFDFSNTEIEQLAGEFAAQIPSGEFSPADLQGWLLKHKSTPDKAAAGVLDWVAKTREEKERRKKADATQTGPAKQLDAPAIV